MRIVWTLGCLLGVVAMFALAAPTEAGIATNRLAGNKLSSNTLATNRLAGNKLASNTVAGEGAFTDIRVVEFPHGLRLTR